MAAVTLALRRAAAPSARGQCEFPVGQKLCRGWRAAKTQVFDEPQWSQEGAGQPVPRARAWTAAQ